MVPIASRWQPFNPTKKESVAYAYSQKVRPSTHTNISTPTHTMREHLVCLLLVRRVIIWSFYCERNSLNAIKKNCVFRNPMANIEINSQQSTKHPHKNTGIKKDTREQRESPAGRGGL